MAKIYEVIFCRDVMCGSLHCDADESVEVPLNTQVYKWKDHENNIGKCYTLQAVYSYSSAHWLVPNGAPCGYGKVRSGTF